MTIFVVSPDLRPYVLDTWVNKGAVVPTDHHLVVSWIRRWREDCSLAVTVVKAAKITFFNLLADLTSVRECGAQPPERDLKLTCCFYTLREAS